MRRQSSLFSLIELVVVATVAPALLGGLLLPAMGRSREIARRAQCTNNQKQMTLGLDLFAHYQFDQRFPGEIPGNELNDFDSAEPLLAFDPGEAGFVFIGNPLEDGPQALRANLIYFNRLYGQGGFDPNADPEAGRKAGGGGKGMVSDPRVFLCPSVGRFRADEVVLRDLELFTPEKPVDYGANFRIRSYSLPNALSLGDRCRTGTPSPITDPPAAAAAAPDNPASGINHGGEGFNFGFRDGHVKWHRGAPAGQPTLAIPESSAGPRKSVFHSAGDGRADDGLEPEPTNREDAAVF